MKIVKRYLTQCKDFSIHQNCNGRNLKMKSPLSLEIFNWKLDDHVFKAVKEGIAILGRGLDLELVGLLRTLRIYLKFLKLFN